MEAERLSGKSEFDPLWASYWSLVQQVGPLTHTRYRLILEEIPSLPPKPRILDVGCGSGTLLKLLRRRFPDAQLQGVEVSSEARRIASDDIRDAIACGDIVQLASEFDANSFDLLVCSEVLEHVQNPAQVMAAAAGLLKPAGIAVFTVPAGMRHWSSQDDAAGHLRRFEPSQFTDLMQQCGLTLHNHYTWGGPVSSIYNRLISMVGPAEAAGAARSVVVRMLATAVAVVMHFDDLFKSKSATRFQLVASARKQPFSLLAQ